MKDRRGLVCLDIHDATLTTRESKRRLRKHFYECGRGNTHILDDRSEYLCSRKRRIG